MRSCWSCNTEIWSKIAELQNNQGDEALNHLEETVDVPEPITIHQHLQRCWTRTPDSITSNRIWSRYRNVSCTIRSRVRAEFNQWYDTPVDSWETIKPTEFTARECFTAVSVQEDTTSELSSRNPCRHYNSESKDWSMIDPQELRRQWTVQQEPLRSWLQESLRSWLQELLQADYKAAASWLQELLQADYKPLQADYGSIT